MLLFLYGLITGCTNENLGCALIGLEIIYIIYYKRKYKYIPKWAITALIGTIIGYIFLIVSPGNYIRAKKLYKPVNLNILNIIVNFFRLTYNSFVYLFYIILIVIIAFFLKIKTLFSDKNPKIDKKISIIF